MTAATATQLTVTFTTAPASVGDLSAVVTSFGGNSGSAIEVAAVSPSVTSTAASLPINTTTLTINGAGFDTTPGNNAVLLNNGVGTVTYVNPAGTQLVLTFVSNPTQVGNLTAVVTTDTFFTSGGALQVGTVVPAVTVGSTALSTNASPATTLTINGDFGTTSNTTNDSVTLSVGSSVVTASIVSASSSQIVLNNLSGLIGGTLNAVVQVLGNASSTTQVAIVGPVVPSAVTPVKANVATFTISGTGFDTNPANNSVTFETMTPGYPTIVSDRGHSDRFQRRQVDAGPADGHRRRRPLCHGDGQRPGGSAG